jgi:membrane protein YdbS with pleckstrin-like domain
MDPSTPQAPASPDGDQRPFAENFPTFSGAPDMRSQDLETSHAADIRLVRRYTRLIAARLALVGLFDFLSLRIFAPELINLHQDWAVVAGAAFLVAAMVATAWLAFQVWTDLRRFQQERRDVSRSLH